MHQPGGIGETAAAAHYCPQWPAGVPSPPMTAGPTHTSSTSLRKRQPVWPWLLMPLATLAIFIVLHNAKRAPRQAAAPHAVEQNSPTSADSH